MMGLSFIMSVSQDVFSKSGKLTKESGSGSLLESRGLDPRSRPVI